ncbi:MAG: hypothetical protein R2848_17145 [Thermomicrobiales bacterium]
MKHADWACADISESDTYDIWIEDDNGNRISINQQMIVNGMAFEGDLPDSARFAAWLEQSEELARSTSVGIWELCS